MKIRELIGILEGYDSDIEVALYDDDWESREIEVEDIGIGEDGILYI